MLLVSPERLNNPDFRDRVLPRLTASAGMLVVDEAHCVSDWGHDFRPDYRRLRALIADLPAGIPVLATTATANDRVVVDVTEQLGLASGEPLVLRGSLDRESLRLSVVRLATPAQRLGWLAEHLDTLPGAGIVYTLTIAAAEEVAEFLRERGHPVASYTGKTEPEERLAAEGDLLANRVKALVATSALGMGFDKPDLGFVVHLGAPASPVAYYQQIGRAGRAVERAEVVLLPGREDRDIWAYFASLAFPPEPLVRQTLRVLGAAGGTAVHRRRRDAGRPLPHPPGDAAQGARQRRRRQARQGRVGRHRRGVGLRRRAPPPHRRGPQERAAGDARLHRHRPSAAWCSSAASSTTRTPARAGAATTAPAPRGAATVADEAADAAEERISRPGVEVAPRKQWPSGMAELGVPASGRIPAGELADTGRVIGRLSDIGWGTRLRELVGDPDLPDAPVPKDVLDASVRVLAGWGWAERPVGVVGLGSRTRPHQLDHLARRIAEIGRLPLLGTLVPAGPRPAAHANSPQRLAAVWEAFEEPGFPVPDGPVLLVDDVIDSGWTMTVAARLLRLAGARAVLPFALAQSG